MTRSTPVESPVDDDVDTTETAASEPLAMEASEVPSGAARTSPPDVMSPRPPSGGESRTPIFDELAPAWTALQDLLAEEVPADATA